MSTLSRLIPTPDGAFRVAWASAAVVALSRAVAYSNVLGPAHDSPGPMFLTDDGRTLWWFALLWAAVGIWLLIEATRKTWVHGFTALGTMMSVWGVSYWMAWQGSGFTSPDWITCFLYTFLGLTFISAGLAIPMRSQRIRRLETENAKLRGMIAMTGPTKTVRGEGSTEDAGRP